MSSLLVYPSMYIYDMHALARATVETRLLLVGSECESVTVGGGHQSVGTKTHTGVSMAGVDL